MTTARRPRRTTVWSKLARALRVALLGAFAVALGLAGWYRETRLPLLPAGTPAQTLIIRPGSSVALIGQQLQVLGFTPHPLVFRVLLVSAFAFLGRRLLQWRPAVAAGVAAGLSAVIFAAFHYIGPYGDPLRLDSFVFRLIGGLAFSVLYVVRGFGITAWTHTLYDLLALMV